MDSVSKSVQPAEPQTLFAPLAFCPDTWKIVSMKDQKKVQTWLEAVVHAKGDKEGPALAEALAELDRLWQSEGAGMDPHFRHYLEKRSYTKALDWMREQGKDLSE